MKTFVTAAAASLGITLLLLSALARAEDLDLNAYQGPDGAIYLNHEARIVDPYFATKALLEARHAGADIHRAGTAWVNWALPRQLADGRFSRYCRVPPEPWRVCANADADDAMMAVWMQLLIELAPAEDMPAAWRRSVHIAAQHLASLFNPGTGIYFISATQPVGLFMDNVEIYAGLRAQASWYLRRGARAEALRTEAQLKKLQQGLVNNFWDAERQRFRVSTQQRQDHAFYPDEVAQIYPWIENMPTPHAAARRSLYRQWMAASGRSWLRMEADHFPWGLVAIAALRMDQSHAQCWLVRAAPLRQSERWNVLEEAIFQALQMRFGTGRSCAAED